MSYISAITQNNTVIVWERTKRGREQKHYPAPYYFFYDDADGKYTTIYGTKVSKVEARKREQFYKLKQDYSGDGLTLWESDIPPEMRILAKHYHEATAPKLHVTFYDIEIDYDPEIGFASPTSEEGAYAPINSIALTHMWKNKIVILAVPPEPSWDADRLYAAANEKVPFPTDIDVEIIVCGNEKELLMYFLTEIEDTDVICGWNSDFFDTPYVGRRLFKHFGVAGLKKLDFAGTNTPAYKDVMNRDKTKVLGQKLELSGRINADYLLLYKKYEFGERASYKLSSIEQEVDLKLPKLEYDGSLRDLYYKDFGYFVRYNLRDCEILRGFEQRLGYVELANQMYHLSCGLFPHVTGTLKLFEYAIINYCHFKLNQVVNDFKRAEIDRQIDGALVLQPQIGLHEYIGSIDINSLYPSAIRSLNISPEMLRGQFVEFTRAVDEIAKESNEELTVEFENRAPYWGATLSLPAKEWRQRLKEMKWAISGYGTIFDQAERGIIPTILAEWFATRKQYQAKKKDAERKAADILAKYKKDPPKLSPAQEDRQANREGEYGGRTKA